MSEHEESLDDLRARLDAHAAEEDTHGHRWAEYAAVLDRLAALRREAEEAGWTSLALEREGSSGGIRLFGIPPGETLRCEVPDSPGSGPP